MYKILELNKYKEVKGKPCEVFEGIKTFVHGQAGDWYVSEESTGRLMAFGKTQKEAIEEAKKKVERYVSDGHDINKFITVVREHDKQLQLPGFEL